MSDRDLHIGNTVLKNEPKQVTGNYVTLEGEEYYVIGNYDRMRPFFISLVSHSDHWMFLSTTGGLSAGRKNSNSSLFPYYTDDKISDFHETTGSKTIFRVKKEEKTFLWEPFSNRYQNCYRITRNLYKNFAGNKIIFEEQNEDLGLTFQYSWRFSEKYGIIKKSSLKNTGSDSVSLALLDGLQNILPYGVNADLQNGRSNLTNAYKKNELESVSGLGMFMLSSMIVDKAEPSEALKTTTTWSVGIDSEKTILSSLQINAFRRGEDIHGEEDVKAESGAFLIYSNLTLSANDSKDWFFAAEVNQDHNKVVDLIKSLVENKQQLLESLLEDIEKGTHSLLHLSAMADGLQFTADKLTVSRHYSNVLFNIMRGGIFEDQYKVDKSDLLSYVQTINKDLFAKQSDFFTALGEEINYPELIELASSTGNPDVIRICYEYLPLTFSRRHGDPSRPWNAFSIVTKNDDGSKKRSYEGNWRDIFQNWEALSVAFPGYIVSMITKFVNASTADGYNPYRVTRNGIDWEIIEPDDPWSYIGYWGDHQIIYLQKLMEVAMSHQKDDFLRLLNQPLYVYANVPYRIKGYNDIVKDPQDTIDFDHHEEATISKRVLQLGADGKLAVQQNGDLSRATLAEKLLVTLLAKLSNFVPEGGIWLNTQRPEWNDANNALVGNGVSMVTLYYMRRYVAFCQELFKNAPDDVFQVNHVLEGLFDGIHGVFVGHESKLAGSISDQDRRIIVDELGKLGEAYRSEVYRSFDGKSADIDAGKLTSFLELTLKYLDHTIRHNKRSDGLYHAYNLIDFKPNKAGIDHLYEMLEGQVAVLSAGVLNLEEALEVLDALKQSKIYRADQYSYMLYPNRELPRFLEKNCIPDSFIQKSKLASALEAAGDHSLLRKDANGGYHFNGAFNNAKSLREALENLKHSEFKALVEEEYDSYLGVFEDIFNHKAFTGRSGTFFGYEGLGSIYWHMVSKLLLATQENIYWGGEAFKGTVTLGKVLDHYYEIRAGIGINKSPDLYGSFPTDPYSHTPGNKGVQQPGMTGQVKEDILNRWAELGVCVENSSVSFKPLFLSQKEFIKQPGNFEYYNLDGARESLELNVDELAFTYCQVPIVYHRSEEAHIHVTFDNGQTERIEGNQLTSEHSAELFSRTNKIRLIRVHQNFHS